MSNPNQIIENKTVLLEYLTSSNINKEEVKENVLEEFKNQDKDIRVLAYRVLLEKFNDKYADLNSNQKKEIKIISIINSKKGSQLAAFFCNKYCNKTTS